MKSLRARINLLFFLLISITIFVFFIFSMVKIRKQFLNYSAKNSVLIGNLILERVKKIGNGWEKSNEIIGFIKSISLFTDLEYVAIIKKGKTMLRFPFENIKDSVGIITKKDVAYYLNMDNYLQTVMKSRYDQDISVQVRLSLEEVKKEFVSVIINYLIISFIMLSLSYFSILFLSRIITEPLKEISLTAKGISKGDYREIDIVSSDEEIDELIRAFNKMAVNLRKTIDENKLAIIGKMSAGIAHEIRNPLVSIRGLTEIFLEDTEDEEQKKDLEVILKEVTRLNQFTEQLLQFSRPKEIVFEKMNLKQALEDIITMLKHECKEKNIKILTHIIDDADILGDFDSVKQVLLNILFNAIQFSDHGGIIDIKNYYYDIDKNMIKMEISDKGKGIPENEMQAIFEPFYTTRTGGSGLGLAIVKRIMQSHGGDIIIFSKEGLGTTVELLFPALNSENS